MDLSEVKQPGGRQRTVSDAVRREIKVHTVEYWDTMDRVRPSQVINWW